MVIVLLLFQAKKIQSNDNALVSSAEMIPDDTSDSLESLAKKLNLVIPVSVKECRKKGERLSDRARQDVIKHSLIILQATVCRDRPTEVEYELCAQKIIQLIPELREPQPPIQYQTVFKPWVSACIFNCHMSIFSLFVHYIVVKRVYSINTGLSIRPGTRRSSGRYSVVNHPLLCRDCQLNAFQNCLTLLPSLACSDTYSKSY